MPPPSVSRVAFTNCRLCCVDGSLEAEDLVFSPDTGRIVQRASQGSTSDEAATTTIIDLGGAIVAPGFLELQTNGMLGFHFTHFENEDQYNAQLARVSKYLVTKGVTAFWATIPTVHQDMYKKILPLLTPRVFEKSATLLGAHVEGPFLTPAKKGAHNETLFKVPVSCKAESLYGVSNLQSTIKLVTIAPELKGSCELTSRLCNEYNIRVSMGHSSATYDDGVQAVNSGASALTHLFNAMNPLHHRNPGLAGLISLQESEKAPYYSLIADGIHLHPASLALAYRVNPKKAILITDSIELAGLPDGTHPGHAQIPHRQTKIGNRVVIEGTDTLIGSCCDVNECVRNLVQFSGCSLCEAVRCVTENIARMMRVEDMGNLSIGSWADLVVLDDDGNLKQTWVRGVKVFEANGQVQQQQL